MRALLLSAVALPLILPQAAQAEGQKKTVKQRVKKAADKVFIKAVETLAKPGLNRAVREKEAEEAAKSKAATGSSGKVAEQETAKKEMGKAAPVETEMKDPKRSSSSAPALIPESNSATTESLTPEQRKLQAQMEQQNQEAIEKLRGAKAERSGGERKEAKPRNVTPEQLEKEANRAMDAAEKDRQKTLEEQIDNESPARKEARIKWETARDDPNVPETEKSKLRQAAALALVKDNQRTSEQKAAQKESNLAARKAAAPVVEVEAASVQKAPVKDSTPKAGEVGETLASKTVPKKMSEMSDAELSDAMEKGKYQRIKNADGTVTHKAETRESANAKAEIKKRKAAGSWGVKLLGKSPAAVTVPIDEATNESRMKNALERQAAPNKIDTPEPSEAPASKAAPKKLSEMSDAELSDAVEKGKYQRIKNADGTVTHKAETRESANAKAEIKKRKAAGSWGVKLLGKSPAAVTVPMDEAKNEARMKNALEKQAAAARNTEAGAEGGDQADKVKTIIPTQPAVGEAAEGDPAAKKAAAARVDSPEMESFKKAKVAAQDGDPETAQKRLDAFKKLTLREKMTAIKDGYQEAKDQKAAAKAQGARMQMDADSAAVGTQDRIRANTNAQARPTAPVGAAAQGAGAAEASKPARKSISSRLQGTIQKAKEAAVGKNAPTKLGAIPVGVTPGSGNTVTLRDKVLNKTKTVPLRTYNPTRKVSVASKIAGAAVEASQKLQQRKTKTTEAAATETTSLKKKATTTKQKIGKVGSSPVIDTAGGSTVKKNVPKTPKPPKQQRRPTNT